MMKIAPRPRPRACLAWACVATVACANLAITLISHGMVDLMKQEASVLIIAIKLIAACA